MIPAIFVFLLIGCAQWGGDNPLGITGGSEEGYGQNGDLNLPQPADGNIIDPELIGMWVTAGQWVQTTYTFAFNASGTFTIVIHSTKFTQVMEGTYSVSGNTLTFNIYGGETLVYTYSVNNNHLTLDDGDVELILTRADIIIE